MSGAEAESKTELEAGEGELVVHRYRDRSTAVAAVADRLVALTCGADPLILGLPTGRTMVPLYSELVRRQRAGTLDLRRHRGMNLDELQLPAGHPASFATYMQRHVFGPGLLDPARCEIPRLVKPPGHDPGRGVDADLEAGLEAECQRYEARLQSLGGLDVALLGLGEDGHVAYNLPGLACETTHPVLLPDAVAETLEVRPAWRPLRAITLGMGAFRDARRLVMLVTGASKAPAVQALLARKPDRSCPASLLRSHPRFELFLDEPAARLLS